MYACGMDDKVSKKRNNMAIIGGIAVIVIFCGVFYVSSGGRVATLLHSTNTTHGDSFHPNAWKYSDLIYPNTPYTVDHVVDGDTLVVTVAGTPVTVRLIGMDTPETVDPRKPVGCYGPEASAEAKRIFGHDSGDDVFATSSNPNGSSVYLERDHSVGDYDKYGRVLAYAALPQGVASSTATTYNEYMIRNGYAREYTYMNQSYAYQQVFRLAERQAKKQHLGVWDTKICPAPS